jgi:hypothetical protein
MKRIISILFLGVTFYSCYSFKGVSIPSDVKTFYVRQVRLNPGVQLAPPDSPERFMEQFRLKIRSQSSLLEDDINPHIEFDCEITGYRVSNEGNQQGNEVSLNKLTISVKVAYINNNDEEENWNKSFSFGIPFDPSEDLQEVQDGYIEDIFEQISENIFNDAFTNW